jgi:capsid protein
MILGPNGQPYQSRPAKPARRVRAAYDAAQTTRLNERHWAAADALNPRDAANPRVRAELRKRARYLCYESSPTACGMIRTLALDAIRTGPRLQLIIPGWTNWARELERRFKLWSYGADLVEHLITLCQAKRVDGEAFAAFTSNRKSPTPVQLALTPFECDLVRGPTADYFTDNEDDGIVYDADGNPAYYYVWDDDAAYTFTDYTVRPASEIIHLFRRDRPGQRRGIPEIATSIELLAKSGRFTSATILAAEAAANYAGVIFSEDPDQDEDAFDAEAGDTLEMNHNEWLVLPNGRKAQQFKPEHPSSTYAEFKRETIRDSARCVSQPYAIAAGDSSDSNYASGRLDFQTYDQSIDQEREYIVSRCLDRVFTEWYREARLIRGERWDSGGAVPDTLPPISEWDWVWHWDKRQHVDPLKEANADKTLLSIGATDRYRIAQKQGRDLDADDERAAKSYGVSVQEYRRALFLSTFPAAQPAATGEDGDGAAAREEEVTNAD